MEEKHAVTVLTFRAATRYASPSTGERPDERPINLMRTSFLRNSKAAYYTTSPSFGAGQYALTMLPGKRRS